MTRGITVHDINRPDITVMVDWALKINYHDIKNVRVTVHNNKDVSSVMTTKRCLFMTTKTSLMTTKKSLFQ